MSIPDKYHRAIQKMIDKLQPQSIDELQALMDTMKGKTIDELMEEPDTPEDKAFDLVDEAWEVKPAQGKKLAMQALQLWPDCIPAHEYLAAMTTSANKRIEYLEKGVTIGQRLFGGKFLEEHRGHFWGIAETRPYMRCLDKLARGNFHAGNFSKAIVIWEDMLSLNPNDNQGVRYSLLPAYLAQQDLRNYRRFREQCEESGTLMIFNDTLAGFMESGDSPESRSALRAGMATNPFVVPLLLADAPPKPEQVPGSYIFGSSDEAIIYVNVAWRLWHNVPGAVEWIKGQQSPQAGKGTGRTLPPLDKLPFETVRVLTSDPYGAISPLKLRRDLPDEAVGHLAFLRLVMGMLAAIQEQQPLKLTPKGNLPRKIVHQMYDLRHYQDKYVDEGKYKLSGEENFMYLHLAHILCKGAKLLTVKSNKLSLSKKGLTLLDKPAALYLELLPYFTERFNWAYLEHWGYGVAPTGQSGWACILYEMLRLGGQEKSNKYYGEQYQHFFSFLLQEYPVTQYGTQEDKFQSDFKARFFYQFCNIFDLVEVTREIKGEYDITKEFFVKRSALCEKVFRLDATFAGR